jgi:predicted CopG family antitoxin
MPQKTVTLDDQVYWELSTLEKGRVSAFVNEALKTAISNCHWEPSAYVRYAQEGVEAARREVRRIDAAKHPNQENLDNIEWMKKQKEAEE